MKKTISLLLGITAIVLFSFAFKGPAELEIAKSKLGDHLFNYLLENNQDKQAVYIYFADKGPDIQKYLSNPLSLVTQKSLDRRAKVLPQNALVGFNDVPLYAPYVQQVASKTTSVRHELYWLNCVSADAYPSQIYEAASLGFVTKIELVEKFRKSDDEMTLSKSNTSIQSDNPLTDSLSYGSSLTQNSQIKTNIVHDLGDYGQGVIIGHFDAGYLNLNHEAFTTLPMKILKKKDFHTGDTVNIASHSHGQATLSLVGGYKPGQLIGPAFRASFILCRTEVDPGEMHYEMDHWIAAAQWVDSLGADIITSSLGYLEFDSGTSYTYMDMNGHTLPITLAAIQAARNGIIVCNSAGNNGSGTVNTLNGPADADSIVTVGSVNSSGTRSSFSSVGPTTDTPARIKPDVMAMGEYNQVATQTGYSTFGSGTSWSCPMTAGAAAQVLAANKNLTPVQVRDILRKFGSNNNSPNNLMGWGILDAQKSVDTARKLDNVPPTIIHTQPFTTTINTGTITLKARVFDNGIIRNTRSEEAPRIYFRKNTGSGWSSYTMSNYTSMNLDTFYFQISPSSLGTQVEYYFAAQDIALPTAFCSTLPAGGSGITPPGSTAPPTRFLFTVSATGIVNEGGTIPTVYNLFNNYPNPFNPSTKIKFALPSKDFVSLKVYDITGKLVSTLVNSAMEAGNYNVEFNAANLSSGIYFYKLETAGYSNVKKMILIK
ncbi:MAG TPA: S8/S53 family peptidase [Ignavibacteria bacterium]|nr:S8/S53 family peptidase [Ignavibacteria bacterium]